MSTHSSVPTCLVLTTFVFLVPISLRQPSNAQNSPFICALDKQQVPTTYALQPNGSIPVFKWKSTAFPPPFTPMRRCQEVTQRMNNFKAQGISLKNFQNGTLNNESVICVGSCNSSGNNLLFTLRKDQSPKQVLQALIASSKGAGGFLTQSSSSGQSSQSALSEAPDGTVTFDLEAYLQSATPEEIPKSGASSAPSESNNTEPSNPPNQSNPSQPDEWDGWEFGS